MTDASDDFYRLDIELSEREIFFIGSIVAQWGALEHEVFTQTLCTFDVLECENIVLPKAMNNLQFTDVLTLWKDRVADKAEGRVGEILRQQFEKILKLLEYRNALVHGMWNWSKADPAKINIVRIRKKEVITTHFTADDLGDFADRVAAINFNIRFPNVIEDLGRALEEQGSYISRRALSFLISHPVADDFLPAIPATKDESNLS